LTPPRGKILAGKKNSGKRNKRTIVDKKPILLVWFIIIFYTF